MAIAEPSCVRSVRASLLFILSFATAKKREEISDAAALEMFQAAVGAPVEAEILSRDVWTAGHALVAERFQRGRILLGGDAAHLFTPTGGLDTTRQWMTQST